MSEIPVLGIYSNTGVVLIIPDKDAQSGDKLDWTQIPVCRDDRICKHFPPGVVKTQARKASSQIELLANGASGDTGLFYEIPWNQYLQAVNRQDVP